MHSLRTGFSRPKNKQAEVTTGEVSAWSVGDSLGSAVVVAPFSAPQPALLGAGRTGAPPFSHRSPGSIRSCLSTQTTHVQCYEWDDQCERDGMAASTWR